MNEKENKNVKPNRYAYHRLVNKAQWNADENAHSKNVKLNGKKPNTNMHEHVYIHNHIHKHYRDSINIIYIYSTDSRHWTPHNFSKRKQKLIAIRIRGQSVSSSQISNQLAVAVCNTQFSY